MKEDAKEEKQVSENAQANEEVADVDISEEKAAEEIEEILEEETAEETVEAEEEEAKPRKKKEEEFVEERIYTIPLAKALVRPPKKRAPRAMQIIKAFITKHMKLEMHVEAEEERGELPKLVIGNDVNEKVWGRGIEKPPRKIRVRAAKDKDGNVTLYLAEGE